MTATSLMEVLRICARRHRLLRLRIDLEQTATALEGLGDPASLARAAELRTELGDAWGRPS